MTDDEILRAYVECRLDEAAAARVEAALDSEPGLVGRLERLTAAPAIAAAFAPLLDAPLPPALAAAARMAPSRVVDLAAARARRRPAWQSYGAIAATLVIGLLAGVSLRPGDGVVAEEGGRLVATRTLADALDAQLASAGEQAGLRAQLSFRDDRGRICRSFAGTAAAGIACRADDRWVVERLVGSERQGAYRQVGADPALGEWIDAHIVGEPFDAAAEARMRDRGWR